MIKQFIHKFFLKKISVYIAPSESIGRDFFNQCIISSPIIVVHNGIELMEFSPISNYKKLLYVGRLSKEKGVSVLLEATRMIKECIPDIIVDIVGDGPDKDMLVNMSKYLGIEKNIRFLGNIPHNRIESFYKKCTLLIVPSVCADNFPTVCIEAMSIGRPIIGSNAGGIPELVDDGSTGFLVHPGNARQVADKAICLLRDLNLIKAMSEKAAIKSRSLSLDENVNNLEQLYKKLLIVR
jgi:colanic acid/amylovoran biosynthesis glycosyltransferase